MVNILGKSAILFSSPLNRTNRTLIDTHNQSRTPLNRAIKQYFDTAFSTTKFENPPVRKGVIFGRFRANKEIKVLKSTQQF